MKKRVLNQIAKDYASCIVHNAMLQGSSCELLTDSEQEYLSFRMSEISDKIGFNGFRTLDDIVTNHILQDQLNRKQK